MRTKKTRKATSVVMVTITAILIFMSTYGGFVDVKYNGSVSLPSKEPSYFAAHSHHAKDTASDESANALPNGNFSNSELFVSFNPSMVFRGVESLAARLSVIQSLYFFYDYYLLITLVKFILLLILSLHIFITFLERFIKWKQIQDGKKRTLPMY